ncbi:hypothetical protein G5C65_00605, partial [Streptomyces sp. SB3404]|nr:hypothetical protein [Streptomyces boncukensis]
FKDEPPPPPPPQDFIKDAKRDKAPLSAGTLFDTERFSVQGRDYALTKKDTSGNCADAAYAGLGPVLTRHDCGALYRATYRRGGLAVTIGIATFQDTATAARVRKEYAPNLVALPGGGVPDFCRTVTCRTTANQVGRYAYFTIAGRVDGKPSGTSDTAATRAARDGSDFARARILQRGREQAEKSVRSPS